MKKIILILFLIIYYNLFIGNTYGLTYPVSEVSKVECKFKHWFDHDADCKQSLPIIRQGDYESYKKDLNYRLVYSVLWGATYDQGWDIGWGSHLGVDIATAEGTPVYAISAGEVVVAGKLSGRGNTVVIKHKIRDNVVFSVYAHLSKISITKGDIVTEGDKIGEVGHTGNARGNHLHFQIDIVEKSTHPYYYSNCQGGVSDIVNNGICREFLLENTIDPIAFLETNGAILTPEHQKQKEEIKEHKINPADILSRKQLEEEEIKLFISYYKISIRTMIDSNVLTVGENGKFLLQVYSSSKQYNGAIPGEIEIITDEQIISALPTGLKFIENGKREIVFIAKKPGISSVIIKYNKFILGKYIIRVIDKNMVLEAKSSTINIFGNTYIGYPNIGIVFMQDNQGYNIIKVPFAGNYEMKISANAKFCNYTINKLSQINDFVNYPCPTNNLVATLNYNYDSTLKSLFLFKIVALNEDPIEITLWKNGKQINKWNNAKSYLPKDLDLKNPYTQYVISALKQGLLKNKNKEYFAPQFEVKEAEAISWIINCFPKAKFINGDNYKKITRLEFMQLWSKMTGIVSSNNQKKYRDTTLDNISIINILVDKQINFKDGFGDKYFQPNKLITREEIAYLLEQLKN